MLPGSVRGHAHAHAHARGTITIGFARNLFMLVLFALCGLFMIQSFLLLIFTNDNNNTHSVHDTIHGHQRDTSLSNFMLAKGTGTPQSQITETKHGHQHQHQHENEKEQKQGQEHQRQRTATLASADHHHHDDDDDDDVATAHTVIETVEVPPDNININTTASLSLSLSKAAALSRRLSLLSQSSHVHVHVHALELLSTSLTSSFWSSHQGSIILSWSFHNMSTQCSSVLGTSMLEKWDNTHKIFCKPKASSISYAPSQSNQSHLKSSQSDSDTRGRAQDIDIDTKLLFQHERDKPTLATLTLTTSPYASISSSSSIFSINMTSLLPGSLVCRSTVLSSLPPPTAPHSYCSGTNIWIDFNQFTVANAPKYRAHYVMGHQGHYHFKPKTFNSQCTRTEHYSITSISADHQRDVVDAFDTSSDVQVEAWNRYVHMLYASTARARDDEIATVTATAPDPDPSPLTRSRFSVPFAGLLLLPHTLLQITRESGEHMNLYHTMTDFWNAWLMMIIHGLQREKTQVLLLDNHSKGPFDVAWQRVYSGAGPLLHAQDLLAHKHPQHGLHVLSSTTVMSPPGYASPLYRHLYDPDDPQCTTNERVDLFPSFSIWFLHGFDIHYTRWSSSSTFESIDINLSDTSKIAIRNSSIGHISDDDPHIPWLHVVIISRKPYHTFVDHKKMSRQIYNEESLFDLICTASINEIAYHSIRISLVDLAHLTFEQQLRLISSTDLLVGMHGAALSHAMFLPPWAGVMELHSIQQRWMCFKHQTEWSGHSYWSWRNANPSAEKSDDTGDGVVVDPISFKQVLDQAIIATREKRRKLDQQINTQ